MGNRIKKRIVEANNKGVYGLPKTKLVEDSYGEDKVIPLSRVYSIAKKAGAHVSDCEDDILNLYMVYSDSIGVPTSKIKAVLTHYDLKFSDLKGPEPKLKPSVEFAQHFNSSLDEDEDEDVSRGVEHGRSETDASRYEWEELYRNISGEADGSEESIKEVDGEEEEEGGLNVGDLRNDVAKFIDKLGLSQFESILKKINTPIEQAEVIAAFAEKVGVPRVKLGVIVKQLRAVGEGNLIKTRGGLVSEVITKSDLSKSIKSNKDE